MRYCSPVVPVSTTTFGRRSASCRVGNGLDDGVVGSAERLNVAEAAEFGLGDGSIASGGSGRPPSSSRSPFLLPVAVGPPKAWSLETDAPPAKAKTPTAIRAVVTTYRVLIPPPVNDGVPRIVRHVKAQVWG